MHMEQEEGLPVTSRKFEPKATINWAKVVELENADDHTLVKYYRKHIPWSCLDQKYKEVKNVTKMGICYHPHCGLPNRKKVERCKMFYCTRCGDINYCSIECQKADWGGHKEFCDQRVERKAAFDSKHSS